MAQVRQVVSEALQATVRRLLPSQQGFTEDLQASNVITPIIDLTPTAEGTVLPVDLARAVAFGSQTGFNVTNATTTIINSTGFWRVIGVCNQRTGGAFGAGFQMSDGLSTKIVWSNQIVSTTQPLISPIQFDLTFFLAAGESLAVTINNANGVMEGSYRQIADVNGNIVNPDGFVSS